MEKLEISYTAGGNVTWYRNFGKHSGSYLKKLNSYYHMIQQLHSKELKTHVPHKNLYTNVHRSIIHNNPKVETPQNVYQLKNKQNVEYLYNGV